MAHFRKAIREEVRSRTIRIRYGHTPADAVAYRRFILSLVCSRGKNFVVKQSILQCVLNGDWPKQIIEIWCNEESTVEEDKLPDVIADALITGLAGYGLTVFPEHRFIKMDEAVDEHGLLVQFTT